MSRLATGVACHVKSETRLDNARFHFSIVGGDWTDSHGKRQCGVDTRTPGRFLGNGTFPVAFGGEDGIP